MKIIEISVDEMSVKTDCGTATFFPVKKVKKTHCRHCWLFPTENCKEVRCGAFDSQQRADGQAGVFSIREMPEI